MSLQITTAQPARHPSPTANATALAHLIFERPDLDHAAHFLTDFGLDTVRSEDDALYLRASDDAPYCYRITKGPRPRFVGIGFRVESEDMLASLAKLSASGSVEPLSHPGGGKGVVLHDPSGFRVEVVHGQARAVERPHRLPLAANAGSRTPRINVTQRFASAPVAVLKLGHLVLEVADFQKTCAWYTEHLGLLPSDVMVLPDGSPAVTFLRLNRGETPAEHHVLVLAQSFAAAFSHGAFEVVDADAIGMGQRVLRERGWKHAWGIGRHILGSQIFDYWKDPWGDKHEHYCDSDTFTSDTPMGVHEATREAMAQWGPVMPSSFSRPKLTLRSLAKLVKNVRSSEDLSLARLVTLARTLG